MTEEKWRLCDDPQLMSCLFLGDKTSDRKMRLFACACCRRVLHLFVDKRSRKLVDFAERFADEIANDEELDDEGQGIEFSPLTSEAAAYLVSVRRYDRPSILLRYGIMNLDNRYAESRVEEICKDGNRFPKEAAFAVARHIASERLPIDSLAQAALFRHVFGNPFRPYPHPASWPSTVVQLTESLYLGNDTRLPLSDALEEAGHPELAEHFRKEEWHPKGCWAMDVVLGKS